MFNFETKEEKTLFIVGLVYNIVVSIILGLLIYLAFYFSGVQISAVSAALITTFIYGLTEINRGG